MPDITIRIEKNRESKENNNAPSSVSKKKEDNNVAVQTIFAQQMISTGKQIISFQANNIANFSGNYLLQDNVNHTLDIIGDISTVALGFVAKGWIGGAVAIAGIATKKIFEVISRNQQDKLLGMEQDYLVKRSGNSTLNGSRGTEN